jgi:hypothetical protein
LRLPYCIWRQYLPTVHDERPQVKRSTATPSETISTAPIRFILGNQQSNSAPLLDSRSNLSDCFRKFYKFYLSLHFFTGLLPQLNAKEIQRTSIHVVQEELQRIMPLTSRHGV